MVGSRLRGENDHHPRREVQNRQSAPDPLSRQSLALLQELPRLDDVFVFVFAGRGCGKPIAAFTQLKGKVDALLDPPLDEWNLHDTRRTVATGLGRLGVQEDMVERVLGHAQGRIERTYNLHAYSDEKRRALQLWSDHVTRWSTARPPAATSSN